MDDTSFVDFAVIAALIGAVMFFGGVFVMELVDPAFGGFMSGFGFATTMFAWTRS